MFILYKWSKTSIEYVNVEWKVEAVMTAVHRTAAILETDDQDEHMWGPENWNKMRLSSLSLPYCFHLTCVFLLDFQISCF